MPTQGDGGTWKAGVWAQSPERWWRLVQKSRLSPQRSGDSLLFQKILHFTTSPGRAPRRASTTRPQRECYRRCPSGPWPEPQVRAAGPSVFPKGPSPAWRRMAGAGDRGVPDRCPAASCAAILPPKTSDHLRLGRRCRGDGTLSEHRGTVSVRPRFLRWPLGHGASGTWDNPSPELLLSAL